MLARIAVRDIPIPFNQVMSNASTTSSVAEARTSRERQGTMRIDVLLCLIVQCIHMVFQVLSAQSLPVASSSCPHYDTTAGHPLNTFANRVS